MLTTDLETAYECDLRRRRSGSYSRLVLMCRGMSASSGSGITCDVCWLNILIKPIL
jgi:hypothetical protein